MLEVLCRLNEEPKYKDLIGLGKLSSIGIELALLVVAGLLIGRYFDRRFETAPWLAIVGLVLGAAAGMYNLYKVSTEIEDKEKRAP